MVMHERVMDLITELEEPHAALCTDAVLACVFAALPGAASVAAAARTCKQWRRVCKFDAVWEALYVRAYGWPDEAEMCSSFRDQYRRAKRLASATQKARGAALFGRGQDSYTVSAAYDPITGCLATVHAFPFGRLSVQVTQLEEPPVPPPPSLGWKFQQLPVGQSYTLYSDEMGAIMVRAFRPIAAHSGRCVYARGGSVLAVSSLRPDGAVLGELNVLTTEIAALVMNSWMCISVSSSGEALFWSFDKMARFGRQPLGFFLRTGPGLPSWSHRVALAPEGGVRRNAGPSSGGMGSKSSLVAIVNFDRSEGPHVLVLKAERTSDTSGGRLSTLKVLGFSNPTSCCFSRGRLVVGSCVMRGAQSFHFFTGLAHLYDTVSWEKLGLLISTEQRTVVPQALLASSPRVHVTGGSVVFEVPRDGLAEQFVLQFRPQHAVCAMDLHSQRAASSSRHLVLSPEDRSPTTTLVENEEEWMEVVMLLSTPSRLLVLTKLQMLLEVQLL